MPGPQSPALLCRCFDLALLRGILRRAVVIFLRGGMSGVDGMNPNPNSQAEQIRSLRGSKVFC